MAHINLLPWREELRARRNKEFGVLAFVAAAVMGGVVFGVHTWYSDQIDFQKQRNSYLEGEIAGLDKKIKEIQDIERERDRLIRRKEKIEELQAGRPDVVHLMDELVTSLPEGAYYTKVEQKGSALSVEGVAQSNARVSSLMRKVDASNWLQNPSLVEIKAETKGPKDSPIKLSTFNMSFQQKKKKKEGEEEEGPAS